jgi:uncharacterized membrane protein YhaH (DUF805 family)
MKWFIKVLTHYADFSGRARRKEYWMFVLFNLVFVIVWTAVLTLAIAYPGNVEGDELVFAAILAYSSYTGLLLLPGLAVVVRRLHDLGKSGWWYLIGLIPVAGAIWLLVLMLTEGQESDNKYGSDPKTTADVFPISARLRSAGITLIVGATVTIIDILYYLHSISSDTLYFICIGCCNVLLFISGIFLLNEKKIYELKGRMNIALILLLISSIIVFLTNTVSSTTPIASWINDILEEDSYAPRARIYIIVTVMRIILSASTVLFVASLLFASKQKNLIRTTAGLIIVFSGLFLICHVYSRSLSSHYHSPVEMLQYLFEQLEYISLIAVIVLAGTFYPKKENESTADDPLCITR